MDPISMAFGAYLNFVSNTVHEQMTSLLGTEVTAVSIEYNGIDIPFQYQMWKVKEKTVCYTYSSNILSYSKCTVTAKRLFNDLCSKLQLTPEAGWRYKKTKNMYCNAAAQFKPTIAGISKGSHESDLLLARKKCNVATVSALGSIDAKLHKARKIACEDYKKLKGS